MKLNKLIMPLFLSVFVNSFANAGLVGTQLTLSVLAQATSTSSPVITSFPRAETVSASRVEFPDVESLFNPDSPPVPGFASRLVNTAINAGDNFIEIDFDNAGTLRFASAFQNTYVFLFDSEAIATITGATINTGLTTLGLTPADVTFDGNRLFVNVESLTFNPNTFARIDLAVEGGPVVIPETPPAVEGPVVIPETPPAVEGPVAISEPATIALLGMGLIGIRLLRRKV